jgi:hypothetical protein
VRFIADTETLSQATETATPGLVNRTDIAETRVMALWKVSDLFETATGASTGRNNP